MSAGATSPLRLCYCIQPLQGDASLRFPDSVCTQPVLQFSSVFFFTSPSHFSRLGSSVCYIDGDAQGGSSVLSACTLANALGAGVRLFPSQDTNVRNDRSFRACK